MAAMARIRHPAPPMIALLLPFIEVDPGLMLLLNSSESKDNVGIWQTGICGKAKWMNASTYRRRSAVLGRFSPDPGSLDPPGESGELTDGCEYLRCVLPKTEGWARLASKACLVASVIESVDTELTELCRALPFIDEEDMLGLSELKLDIGWWNAAC